MKTVKLVVAVSLVLTSFIGEAQVDTLVFWCDEIQSTRIEDTVVVNVDGDRFFYYSIKDTYIIEQILTYRFDKSWKEDGHTYENEGKRIVLDFKTKKLKEITGYTVHFIDGTVWVYTQNSRLKRKYN